MPLRLFCALSLTLCVVFPLGCQTAREVTQRGDLDVTLSRHHVDLRWGRVPHAARFVHPDLRAAFITDWEKRFADIDVSQLEVMQVMQNEAATEATVTVKMVFVEKSTQRLRESVHTERWEYVDGTWMAVKAMLPDDVS